MTDAASNADQSVYWNEAAGPSWVSQQARLDWQLAPLIRAGFAVLAPAKGEAILDIGCGTGASCLELAGLVGAEGAVLGADISATMLAMAQRRADEAGLPQLRFLQADAQIHAFDAGRFDAAFSRFGVMFFADPVAAFANIRKALRPGGRLVFVCWRAMAENPVMTLPLSASAKHFEVLPTPGDPLAPGPFAFADAERVSGILAAAGFADIALSPHDEAIGGRTLDDVIDTALNIGPMGALLRTQPDKYDAVVGSLREAYEPYVSDRGVLLPSATWIVSARNGGAPS